MLVQLPVVAPVPTYPPPMSTPNFKPIYHLSLPIQAEGKTLCKRRGEAPTENMAHMDATRGEPGESAGAGDPGAKWAMRRQRMNRMQVEDLMEWSAQ
jgi:hypothetical protein